MTVEPLIYTRFQLFSFLLSILSLNKKTIPTENSFYQMKSVNWSLKKLYEHKLNASVWAFNHHLLYTYMYSVYISEQGKQKNVHE